MRIAILTVFLASTTACSWGNPGDSDDESWGDTGWGGGGWADTGVWDFGPQVRMAGDPQLAMLNFDTHGVAVPNRGPAQVGMLDAMCAVKTSTGSIKDDTDLDAWSVEMVTEGTSTGTAIVVTDDRVHIVDPDSRAITQIDAVGVVTAVGMGDGVAVLVGTEHCEISFRPEGIEIARVVVPDGACVTGTIVAGPGLAVLVGSSDEAVVVTPEGDSDPLTSSGELVEWDEVARAWYVASRGGSLVHASNEDRSPRWSSPINGAITAIATERPGGAVIVASGLADGTAVISRVDGYTGDVTEIGDADRPVTALSMSPDGLRWALEFDEGGAVFVTF